MFFKGFSIFLFPSFEILPQAIRVMDNPRSSTICTTYFELDIAMATEGKYFYFINITTVFTNEYTILGGDNFIVLNGGLTGNRVIHSLDFTAGATD